ncbi:hypothetical protein HK101_002888 [Irineochytrium annulatum]|nr:hypothetical protein HK101_002888 [Irineochytrium annulatum]
MVASRQLENELEDALKDCVSDSVVDKSLLYQSCVKAEDVVDPSAFAPSPSSLVLMQAMEGDEEDEFDHLCAVFVARFDTLRGNMIEYQYPLDVDLSGVEYQSLPSGSHAVTSDLIYFRKKSKYGLCAFQRHVLTSRDAEMRKERAGREPLMNVHLVESMGLPHLQADHPVKSFPNFVSVFGRNVFALWKYVLLQKRVLFYGVPPVKVLCDDTSMF